MKKLLFVFTLCILSTSMVWGIEYLINEGFENTFPPSGWTNSGCIQSGNSPRTGSKDLCFNGASYNIYTPKLVDPATLSFWYRRSSNTTAWTLNIQISTDASNWTSIGTITTVSTTYQEFTYNLSSYSNIYIRLLDQRTSGSHERYVDDFTVTKKISGPIIEISTTTLTGFGYVQGSGPSSEKSFTISGSNLTANISIDAPTNYEISKNSGDSFSAEDPMLLEQSGGSVSQTTIYVRLKAGLSAGNYNNENITASSTGATSKTVTCSGTVYKPEPSNHCSNFAAANGTDPKSQISLSWTDATGSVIPDGYLIKAATNSYDNIASPVDGTSETDGTYVKNVAAGVQAATFSNLNSNTTYYFKIFSYTNSGTNINYKTDGTIPQVSWTTATGPAIVEIILPQYIQGVNGTNNKRLPWACRLKLENLVANATSGC
ncbi:MAG TPA: hypothetical protein PKM71_05810 [Candidatus Cloacimonas sp.]|nr:hypothetical protein [Candidatus Cloacimonas sp.]